ncbi:MAG: Pyruvate dehydrogenase complex repressor [Syntrophorhabdaceae bacterium PtaU1.Bin034]|jgi:DNA-binding FadR family transcriptional regulator|nr:MAG: Pyruvate dehydrogenase complex repressor [Syntrophorhabdaceae bacterium PtaU1.Bin034]
MFDKVKDRRLFERIVDQIKDAMLSGTLKTGDKLPSENELAGIFGVSRTAVREALRILELSGLVIIKKGKQGGCFVQDAGSNQRLIDYFSDNLRLGKITLTQVTEARFWLESMVIDIVGEKITKKDIDKLRKSIDKAEQLYAEKKEKDVINENYNFHASLVRITKNAILIDALSAILELLSYILFKIKPDNAITLDVLRAHREILSFLETGQPERAKAANSEHMKNVESRLIQQYVSQNRLIDSKKFRSLF